MKVCPRCGDEITNSRKKYCSENCRYWFNSIKKDNEKHLPPVRKRNKEWCHVFVSVGNTISQRGQGKRSGGMIKGSMSANVQFMICQIKPFNFSSVEEHFKMKSAYIPPYIQLGDGTRLSKDDALTILVNNDSAMAAAHA